MVSLIREKKGGVKRKQDLSRVTGKRDHIRCYRVHLPNRRE